MKLTGNPKENSVALPIHSTGSMPLLLKPMVWLWVIKSAMPGSALREKQPPFSPEEIRALAARATRELPPLCARYAGQMGVRYSRVTIRAQHTRWGSCSRKGNLNFNCLLMLCPLEVREYVVVHELCHLKEMNHSPRFWQEVKNVLPGYEAARRWLKTEGQRLIERLPE